MHHGFKLDFEQCLSNIVLENLTSYRKIYVCKYHFLSIFGSAWKYSNLTNTCSILSDLQCLWNILGAVSNTSPIRQGSICASDFKFVHQIYWLCPILLHLQFRFFWFTLQYFCHIYGHVCNVCQINMRELHATVGQFVIIFT